ncbi:MAG: glycosyltransferase family 4 protein [Flavobacteriaceae bacterium]
MRVAIVCDWFLPRFGGIEFHLRDLAVHLKRAGVDVEILTPVPGPALVEGVTIRRLCDETRPNGGYMFPPPPQATSLGDFGFYLDMFFGRRKPTAYRRLQGILTPERYDLAHIHFSNSPFAFAAARHAIAVGLPVLTTFHSLIAHVQIVAALALRYSLSIPAWPVRHTAVSSVAARSLRPLLGPAPVGILHNGTDGGYWSSGADRAVAGPVEIVAAGRLHKRKRLDALVDIATGLAARCPDPGFRLTIAGDGPEMSGLERRIRQHRAEKHIVLAGRLSPAQLRALYGKAQVFVAPAHLESFCLAALEARYAGLPVIAMTDTGARDFLRPGADSILCEDDAEFADALERFLDDGALRQRLRMEAAQPPVGFDHVDVANAHKRVYEEVLADGRLKLA